MDWAKSNQPVLFSGVTQEGIVKIFQLDKHLKEDIPPSTNLNLSPETIFNNLPISSHYSDMHPIYLDDLRNQNSSQIKLFCNSMHKRSYSILRMNRNELQVNINI